MRPEVRCMFPNLGVMVGCVGSVTNGGVRDPTEVEAIGFRLFVQHAIVSHAYCHIVEFGKPEKVGALTLRSGDLLHADMHGVHRRAE